MIALNGKELDLRYGRSSEEKFVREKIEEIAKEFTFPVKVSMPKDYGHKPDPYRRPKLIRYPEYAIRCSEDIGAIIAKFGKETWTWFNNIDSRGDKEVFLPKRIPVRGGMHVIEKDNIDLLFFILYCSPAAINTRTEELKNNKTRKKMFVVENSKEKANKYVSNIRLKNEISAMIIGVNELPEDKIRAIARKHGISKVDSKGTDEVRMELMEDIDSNNRWADVKHMFVEEEEKSPVEDDITGDVQRLIDNEIVFIQKPGGRMSWYYKGKEKNVNITRVLDQEDPRKELVEELSSDKQLFEKLISKL